MSSKRLVDLFIEKASNIFPNCDFKIKDSSGLATTDTRAATLKKSFPEWKIHKPCKSLSIVFTDDLREALDHLKISNETIETVTREYFQKLQKSLSKYFSRWFKDISYAIADLDVSQCSWKLADKFKLTRPSFTNQKILSIEKVRHILIETINQNIKFIPNDCFLSNRDEENENDHTTGMVLYGVNACGKTSYLKSVGLAVVFAQAGMYVPAKFMRFKPFNRIMTRIAGGDNIQRSQSSFVVELEEILSVIQRSNKDTLVIGDEMCRGTEVLSANALVHTTLDWLVKKGVFFLTATHLHGISEKVSLLSKVKIMHMKVRFDNVGEAIYDRTLCEGPGPEKYGLEIAKAMNFPLAFLKEARNFRNEAVNSNVERKSRYNSRKILVRCENCGYKPQDLTSLPLDTHHIEFQCSSDENGYHDTQWKQALHNLIALCKSCHILVHRNQLKIEIQQTVRGTRFIFNNNNN
ncbi:muts domain V-domain-containing protein [Blyttiomyces helicus]|uniref:Muts domain V-domain-containing protein n=1 Tax=Blyttiomyces helicus TaxID=388810 RepID=A0A4V1ISQ7_9FUNG|nr:muts domain V-domain-containing protein [Blyttiomyces helicus]|eukprot:RKO94397.1 muts domain V-domain-containing protein [Blyttiomyces helicus]